MAERIWREDPQLTVLRKLVAEARAVYQSLTIIEEKPEELLMKHKFTVEWIIQEISDTTKTYEKWSRGRHKLTQLLDIRYELIDYVNKTLEYPHEETVRLFNIYREQFERHLDEIELLFGP